MKKLACLGAALCLALTVFVAVPSSHYAAAEDSFVVYVYDEQEWDLSVYCYSGGVDFGPGWPGTSLNRAPEIGDDWYSFELPSDPTGKTVSMIIFDLNNENVNRVEFNYNRNNIYCNTYTKKGFATKEAALADAVTKRPKLVETIYIYNYSLEDNAERWTNIYASCFDNATGDQLGSGVTLEPATSVGAHWYKYDLPAEARAASDADYKFRARVVVSDGEEGKERLTIVAPVEATKYYNTYRDYGFANKTKAADDEFNCVYQDPKTGETTIYFYNSQRWKTVYAYSYWTYVGANNTLVTDFGGWPGDTMMEYTERENWYYIVVPQDVTVQPVNIVFSGPKGRADKDSYIDGTTNLYFDCKGTGYSSFVAVENVTEMADPLPEVGDYMMDFDKEDTQQKTDSVTENKSASLTAPIVVLSIAGGICVAIGAVLIVFMVRRKKNDLR